MMEWRHLEMIIIYRPEVNCSDTDLTFTFFVLCGTGTRLPRMFLVARPKPFHSRFDFVDSRIDSPASSSNTSSKRGWLLNAILLFTLFCSLRKSRRKAVIPRQAKRRSWEGKTQFYTIQAAQRKKKRFEISAPCTIMH